MGAVMRKFLIIIVASIFAAVVIGAGAMGCDTRSRLIRIGMVNPSATGSIVIESFKAELAALRPKADFEFLYGGPIREQAFLEAWARELREKKTDLLLVLTEPGMDAAMSAFSGTKTPLIFWVISNPVKAGYIEDLQRPGSNRTGVTIGFSGNLVDGRRLEWLTRIDPRVKRVCIPCNPDDPAVAEGLNTVRQTAAEIGVVLTVVRVAVGDKTEDVLAKIPADQDALYLMPDRVVSPMRLELYREAVSRKIPLSGPVGNSVEEGALFSYTYNEKELGVQTARMADLILAGHDPGTIPVETPEFSLYLNTATAKAIGLEIAPEILDQVKYFSDSPIP